MSDPGFLTAYAAAETNVKNAVNSLNNIGPSGSVHQMSFDAQMQQALATAALVQSVLAVADELKALREYLHEH